MGSGTRGTGLRHNLAGFRYSWSFTSNLSPLTSPSAFLSSMVAMEAGRRRWTWDAVAQRLWWAHGLLLLLLYTASLLHSCFWTCVCVCAFSMLKFLLNLSQYCFCFLGVLGFFFGHTACEILVPQPEIKNTFPALEGKLLITWNAR